MRRITTIGLDIAQIVTSGFSTHLHFSSKLQIQVLEKLLPMTGLIGSFRMHQLW
jgi:hypothetical protein